MPALLLASGMLLLPSNALGGQSQAAPPAAVPATTAAATMQQNGAEPLRPGDVVRLRIWREPDLSGEFPVDETGVVVLPKIGPRSVTAESPASLREMLVGAYAKFLNHNSIDVTLLRRIQVLGAVRQPGVYPVDPTMTISDVLAVAGGTTTEGDPNRMELIRAGKRVGGTISRASLIGESRVRSGDQIFVPERSWVRRNSGFLVAALITAGVSTVVTLATR
ncbi:MAG TPA: SLBB domain-containing protein [Gemmatimonadaceae bacterium]|nr:SLBB domain-containing protein [Gemmatimonadaceae bacterium]